ncbi:uncharacterized protein LOC134260132 [Saccostrea cucullata]|uniref:uncharacterized protein LOC134260132 n=1 Tax=Saccostrea cuccullata TaxID=36930 RepID=UPI002ED25E32
MKFISLHVHVESFVYLCDFHREQAWERWLKATHNGIGDDKDEILSLLRSVARSKTNEEFELSSNRLKNSHFWTENNRFRKWFEGRWLNKYRRWVQAFRQKRYNTSVNTNNGVERQNKTLKYEFLEAKKAKSLCHLLTILWNDFLPDIYQRYVKLNLISAEESMRYNPDIPTFLINRPRNVVKHCFKRWEEAGNISVDDIDSLGEDQFLVKSQVPESSQVYCVRFSAPDFPVPSCDCEDWAKHHLPCKHFFAVIRNVSGWQWEKLPEEYRNNPFLTLDESVLYEFSSPSYVTHPDSKEDQESRRETNTDSNIQDIILPSKSRLSKIRSNISSYCQMIRDYSYSCKDEEILETLGSKLKDTLDGLTTSLSETDVLPVDNPQKQMTHIATTPAKRINKLSLSKKRNKGVGRHGSSAENMRKHTSKGVHDLLSHESSEVAEEIISIEDDQYSHLEANGMKGILKKTHKGTKQVKKVHFPDSGTMSQTVAKYHEMDYREALEEVNKIWNMEKGTGFFIGKVTNFNITDEDIRSLNGTNWVTDQVIDAYLAAIVQKEIEKGNKVALYPSQTMTQIMDGNFSVGKSRRKLKLYECTSIIGAICKNRHWTLVIVDPLKGFIHYFNPLKETRIQYRLRR